MLIRGASSLIQVITGGVFQNHAFLANVELHLIVHPGAR